MKNESPRITACLIVKNEEKIIARCLASVKNIADEIIVVDTGSHDVTMTIAKKMGAKTYNFIWHEDFSAARNHSLAYATGDWIIWLDADDIIASTDAGKIRKLLEVTPREIDGYMLPYYLSRDAKGRPLTGLYRLRAFRNFRNIRFQYPVHEIIDTRGLRLRYFHEAGIQHLPLRGKKSSQRNLDILLKNLLLPEYKNSVHLLFHLGKEYQRIGLLKEAVEIYGRCLILSISTQQKFIFHNRIAACYERLNWHDEMLKHSFMALKEDPSHPDPYAKIGGFFTAKNNNATAEFWKNAARALPQKPSPDVMNFTA